MRLHVGDHVGAAARAQHRASSTTVANRPHEPRFGSSNTADSTCQFRVPPMRPFPAESHGHVTTSSFGTCEMPPRNDLRPGSGVLRRAATGCAIRASWTRTVVQPRFAGRVALLPAGEPVRRTVTTPGPCPRGSARTNSRLDNHDLATGRQWERHSRAVRCPSMLRRRGGSKPVRAEFLPPWRRPGTLGHARRAGVPSAVIVAQQAVRPGASGAFDGRQRDLAQVQIAHPGRSS